MLYNKGKLLKKFCPLSMFRVPMPQRVEKLKGLVIGIHNKLLGQEIVLPMFKRSDDGIKFFIISGNFCFASFSFSLKKAIGWPPWLKTPPIPIPEASQATSKHLEKSGNIKTEASESFCLMSPKAWDAALVQWNLYLFRHSVMGLIIVLKSRIKRL